MELEEIRRELEQIMVELSPNCQRYLLELARASKEAERHLTEPTAVSFPQKGNGTTPHHP